MQLIHRLLPVRRIPSLSALMAFEAAGRLASFKRAAAELGVTPTAVSHQIRALEHQLNTQLFHRETRQVRLTEDGARLYQGVAEGFDLIRRTVAETTRFGQRQTMTITATSAFTGRWLLPRLEALSKEITNVDFRLFTSDDVVDLHRSDVDLAIRYGMGSYPGLESTLLVTDRFVPVAHPRLGVRDAKDLRAAPIIRFDWRNPHPAHPTWEVWFSRAGIVRDVGAPEYRFSEESHAIQAAVAGQGVALLSVVLIQNELAAGLMQPVPGLDIEGLAYFLVHKPVRQNRLQGAQLERLKLWLVSEADFSRNNW